VHPSLATVHPAFGTPTTAITLLASLTVAAALLGDAVLIPITEVGSLAVGVGWLSASLAWLARTRRDPRTEGRAAAALGALVSATIVAMKVVPFVPGSFGRYEWTAFLFWSALGALFWRTRRAQAAVGGSGS
jgi:hypothetical protein